MLIRIIVTAVAGTLLMANAVHAGISVSTNAALDRTYENFDSAYHGLQDGTNFLATGQDKWYISFTTPDVSVGGGSTTSSIFELSASNALASSTSSVMNWTFELPSTFAANYVFDVSLGFDYVADASSPQGSKLIANGTIIATNASAADATLGANIYNTFDYDLPDSTELAATQSATGVAFSDGATVDIERNFTSGGGTVGSGKDSLGNEIGGDTGSITWDFEDSIDSTDPDSSVTWTFGTETTMSYFTSAVPEPTSLAFTMLAGMGILVRRRSR